MERPSEAIPVHDQFLLFSLLIRWMWVIRMINALSNPYSAPASSGFAGAGSGAVVWAMTDGAAPMIPGNSDG